MKSTSSIVQEVLLTREEAANILNLKPQTLASWACRSLHLPVVKCGRAVRYKLSDLQKFIKRRTAIADLGE